MAYQLQAEDDGVELNLQAGSSVNLNSSTGLEMTVIDPNNGRATYSAASSADGTYAVVTTTSAMFPIGGTYQVQLVATFASNNHLSSPAYPLQVGPRL